jgi:regulator of cell morphogenesis and NO signaling
LLLPTISSESFLKHDNPGNPMLLTIVDINPQTSPAELVNADYRTAKVFQRFGIPYCCVPRLPLETVCAQHGLDLSALLEELRRSTGMTHLPSGLPFDSWSIDFLIDYIINVHHYFIRETFPSLAKELAHFAEQHRKKYPVYSQLYTEFAKLQNEILPHIQQEEESTFPYIRQVAHAYDRKDSYARLLVKTMRKPLARMINDDHKMMFETMLKFRQWTDNYSLPSNSCTSHIVILSKLKELDNDLAQHVHLENDVLFPKILKMEKELLES